MSMFTVVLTNKNNLDLDVYVAHVDEPSAKDAIEGAREEAMTYYAKHQTLVPKDEDFLTAFVCAGWQQDLL